MHTKVGESLYFCVLHLNFYFNHPLAPLTPPQPSPDPPSPPPDPSPPSENGPANFAPGQSGPPVLTDTLPCCPPHLTGRLHTQPGGVGGGGSV